MISQAKIDALLVKIHKSPYETMNSRSICYETVGPGEIAPYIWRELSADEGPVLRAAVKLELVTESYRSWEADCEGERVPDGGDYSITLTGSGMARVLVVEQPWWKKALGCISKTDVWVAWATVLGVILTATSFGFQYFASHPTEKVNQIAPPASTETTQ